MHKSLRIFGTVLLHLVLAVLASVFLVPFAMLLWYALNGEAQFGAGASGPSWELATAHLRLLFRNYPVWSWLASSLFLTCVQTVLTVVLSCLGGYALAKHRFAGKQVLVWVMLGVMMLPGQVLMPASYELMYNIGWLDSYYAIIIPGAVSVFGMFLFRGAFRSLPDELLQAARIDGCGEFRLWWDIAVPCVRPMIGAFTLLVFTGTWNAFLWPSIILSDTASYTLPIGIATLTGTANFENSYSLQMAATFLAIIPVMILFFILQRDFVAGLTSGAVKG